MLIFIILRLLVLLLLFYFLGQIFYNFIKWLLEFNRKYWLSLGEIFLKPFAWLYSFIKKQIYFRISKKQFDYEQLKEFTNKLIELEKFYEKTEIADLLKKILNFQEELLDIYNKNPENFTEDLKRIIFYYTNSISNVLQNSVELQQLQKKFIATNFVEERNKEIKELLEEWLKALENITQKLLNNKYAVLDAEIQSLLNGLKLDK